VEEATQATRWCSDWSKKRKGLATYHDRDTFKASTTTGAQGIDKVECAEGVQGIDATRGIDDRRRRRRDRYNV
jgi:hypothetical protein